MTARSRESQTAGGRAAGAAPSAPARAPIRVIVAESSRAIREYIEATLHDELTIQLISACSDCAELAAALAAEQTDVLITDVRLPPAQGDEGIRIARRLHATDPSVGVVLLGHYAEPAYVVSVLESAPARAYLLIERLAEKRKLIDAIESVAAGDLVVDRRIAESLIEARARVARSPLPRLDREERDLLALIVEGKRDVAIASSLGVPERTVAAQGRQIFAKLGLPESGDPNRRVEQALAYLAEEGT